MAPAGGIRVPPGTCSSMNINWCWIKPIYKRASSWDYGTYHHIGDQRRLGRACTFTQSRQSLWWLHIWSMEVDEEPNQNQTSSPTWWLRMRVWRMSLRRMKSTIISWDGSNTVSKQPTILFQILRCYCGQRKKTSPEIPTQLQLRHW